MFVPVSSPRASLFPPCAFPVFVCLCHVPSCCCLCLHPSPVPNLPVCVYHWFHLCPVNSPCLVHLCLCLPLRHTHTHPHTHTDTDTQTQTHTHTHTHTPSPQRPHSTFKTSDVGPQVHLKSFFDPSPLQILRLRCTREQA